MKSFAIGAMAFLFAFVGLQQMAHADEVKATVEDMKGKANANAEKAKGGSECPTGGGQGE